MPAFSSSLFRCCAFLICCLTVMLAGGFAEPVQAQPEEDDFPPGLLATIHSGQRTVQRVDPVLSFDWDNSGPDPRLKAGPFTADWSGTLLVRQPGSHVFHAQVTGQITILIDGDIVLDERGSDVFVSGPAVELSPGDHQFSVRYTTATGSVPAASQPQLHVFWSSQQFTLEPLPSDILFRDEPANQLRSAERGQLVADAFRCAACHRDSGMLPVEPAPALNRVAGSHQNDSLRKRLQDPTSVVSNSHMPDFGLSEADAAAVAAFLLDVSEKPHHDKPVKLAEADVSGGQLLLTSLGCVACHQLPQQNLQAVPLAEPYAGPDLTAIGERRSAQWLDRWLKDPESLNADHRMPVFELDSEQRRDIVAALLAHDPNAETPAAVGNPAHSAETDRSPQLVARGKQLVERANCAACHTIPGFGDSDPQAVALTRDSLSSKGHRCLNAEPAVQSDDSQDLRPVFAVSDARQQDVTAWLKSVEAPLSDLSMSTRGQMLLNRNGCLACHDRNSQRGLSTLAGTLQTTHPELESKSQGLIPPSLTAVGDKLTDDYLRKAVAGQQPRRLPWLLVQMPKFPHSDSEQADLVRHLIAQDRIPDAADSARQDLLTHLHPAGVQATGQDLLIGNQLTGAGGFNCVACHQAGSFQPRNVALGTRGSDLLSMGDRIRSKFFLRWMQNPIRVVAGIEMPAIKKAMPDVHDGSLARQITTIWHALSDERFTAPTVTSRFEQVVNVQPGDPPRIIRDVFTIGLDKDRDAVARALAIGFDNGHNLLIDLDTLRLRQWTAGEFARQRTEGKSWYWDLAGIPVAELNPRQQRFRLQARDSAVSLLPVADESQTSELVQYRTLPDAVELITRLRFDVEGPAGFEHDSPEPHFTTRRWEDPQHPLQTVTIRHRFEAAAADQHGTGWAHTVEYLDGPSGWDLTVELPEIEAEHPRWSGGIVQIPGTGQVRLTRGQQQRFYAGTRLQPPANVLPAQVTELTSDIEAVTSTPGMSGQRLPLPGSVMPTALTWLPDGRLALTSLKGHVWIARDSDSDGLEDSLTLFEEGLAAPFGILPDGDSVLVAHKPEVLRLTDTDGDGRADLREVVASGWGYNDNYHDWTTGLLRDPEGNLYVGLGSDYSQKERPRNQDRWRGGVIRIDPSGTVTPLAMSFRYPMGLAFDPQGNLWATDNQGVQNTFNEINHIIPGRHYGVPSTHQPRENLQHEVPGLMIPHPWVRSVNSILFLPEDYPIKQLRGHGIGCEYDNRMLIRFTIQNVDGVLQGATYNFSQPDAGGGGSNFIGPICSAISPDGALYIGSIWDSGWQGGLNNGGMTRLVPSADGLPNGIRELRATPQGFEVEFFEPVDQTAAANADSWSIQGYTRVWGGDYATPDSSRHTLTAAEIQVSDDGTVVRFQVDRLQPGFLYDIAVTGPLAKTQQLWPVAGHYSMKTVPTE